jgi:hypothetical protein
MIPVYHPVYAPVHPSGASEDEVETLLAQGWSLTPEAMLTNTVRPMRPSAPAPAPTSEPIIDAADAAVDAMIETETAAEKKNGKTAKNVPKKK